ncbi:MAG TPA: P1 family peptidase, partial [Blastocatellia bacterium]|nr:P1 family peptidase [Blastocatellia bacterium]
VQTNFGGVLTINGAPVGRELGRYDFKDKLSRTPQPPHQSEPGTGADSDNILNSADGSIMIVVATDAPVDHRNLSRIGARAMMGLARTGAAGSNGSGDFAIAFSTAPALRIRPDQSSPRQVPLLSNDAMSPLFLATIEATEEAIYNSLLRAITVTGNGHTVDALPIDKTIEILKKYRALSGR